MANRRDFPPGFAEEIDQATFDQILEMDEEDDEFSRSIVFDFFDQAENTFVEMDKKLEEDDLEALSSLGHFLKGSSATLGLNKVRDSCEKIQHYGSKKDAAGLKSIDEKQALDLIREAIAQARDDYNSAEDILKRYYAEAP